MGPNFAHLLTVRAEWTDPPPLTVSLTVKIPCFFYDSPKSKKAILSNYHDVCSKS